MARQRAKAAIAPLPGFEVEVPAVVVADPHFVPMAKALARTADPETSHEAAEKIIDDIAKIQAWAIACIRKTQGWTQRELGRVYCPEDLRKIGRRLSELAECTPPVLRRGDKRPCHVSGRRAETWYTVDYDGPPAPFPTE